MKLTLLINNITSSQGYARIENSVISEAEIGVHAGRTHDDPPVDRRMWGGGVLNLQNNSFINNYIDIVFSEYNAHTLMAWYGGSRICVHYYNISSVEYNTFYDMKNASCNIFADDYLAAYGFARCHILSSSDDLNVWSIPVNMPVPSNWPPPDYLKGEQYLLGPYTSPHIPNPTKYQCPCRINHNIYKNSCYTIQYLRPPLKTLFC